MSTKARAGLWLAALLLATAPATAQNYPTDDPTIRAIWTEAMDSSQAWMIGQALLDSIGPRLTGTPAADRANAWATSRLRSWGVEARSETYGTWKGWERGVSHVDLLEPRVRTLDATLMAWSPGTEGTLQGGIVTFPPVSEAADFDAWLQSVAGNFVALAQPLASCRPVSSWEAYGEAGEADKLDEARHAEQEAWEARIEATGREPAEILAAIEEAGALGVLWSEWTGGWGSRRIFALNTRFGASTRRVPAIDLSCEDYGLLWRLAEAGQAPRIRALAEGRSLGDVPVANVIGEIPGTELPDEYVVLSAHFDSWDGASGATDNGTGSVVMLEAMRILKRVYPHPRRTIVVGLWASEEQGLNGSRAFAEEHPEVIAGLQAAFNQDNGTGRIARASAMGLLGATANLVSWLSRIPSELTDHIRLGVSSVPSSGGSDHASFICAGAPTFSLWSDSWDYFDYTWHTNLDTFDKIVWENVRANAALYAMLAYLASEGDRVPRDRRDYLLDPETGEPMEWPTCASPDRATSERYQ